MWAGALSGVALAILCGIVFICLFYVAQQQVFKGKGRTIFEAFLMLVASYFVTLLAILMLKYKGYEQKWQAKLEMASNQQVSPGKSTTHQQDVTDTKMHDRLLFAARL